MDQSIISSLLNGSAGIEAAALEAKLLEHHAEYLAWCFYVLKQSFAGAIPLRAIDAPLKAPRNPVTIFKRKEFRNTDIQGKNLWHSISKHGQ